MVAKENRHKGKLFSKECNGYGKWLLRKMVAKENGC